MTSRTDQQAESSTQALSSLSISSRQDDECLIVTCSGTADCSMCIDKLYRPILNQMEDSESTGLVIDKRQVTCSRKEEGLSLIAENVMHYSNRAVLRKLAIVTTIEYKKNDELILETLYRKGVNIRLFTELESAVRWAKAYP